MKEIIKYNMVLNFYPDEFAVNVNDLIKDGWQPYGHTIIINDDGRKLFCQTMVIYFDKDASINEFESRKLNADIRDLTDATKSLDSLIKNIEKL